MSELEELRSFVEVVRSGGFSQAARRLGISKSMVSRRVANLEASLGTRLLSRTTRGVSPTDAGHDFSARAEQILADYEEARDHAASQGGEVIGRLRLSMPHSFGLRHLAPLLAELACAHPRLELDVSFSDRRVDLIGENFDAAIRIGELADSSLVARRIAPSRGLLVASPAYLDRAGRPTSPRDLAQHNCLIYSTSSVPDWQFRDGQKLVSVHPVGRFRSDSGEALLQWAEAGLGIAYLPTFILGDAVEAGRLERLLCDYATMEHGIYILRPAGTYVSGKLRLLTDFLAERLTTTLT